MAKFIDMTGWNMWEHGWENSRLTVIEQAPIPDYVKNKSRRYWLCECNCALRTRKVIAERHLTSQKCPILSCGCLQKQRVSECSKKYNAYEIIDDVVYIYFNNSTEYTTINLDKWESIPYIKELCWYKSKRGYAVSCPSQDIREKLGFNKHVYLHNIICPCVDGFEPDHVDRNKLNNLTSNLVIKTHQKNTQNKSLPINNTSGFIGVSWDKDKCLWRASIGFNGKHIYLGSSKNLRAAIKMRLIGEQKYFGDSAPQRHLYEEYGITEQND